MEFIIRNKKELNELSDYIRKNLVYNVVAFYGEMGSGKTTLIHSLAQGFQIEDQVSSPTFSLLNQYEYKGGKIYHFDFYRIKKKEEVYDLGYEDYFFSPHLCLIEWAQYVEDLLPDGKYHRVEIEIINQKTRKILFL